LTDFNQISISTTDLHCIIKFHKKKSDRPVGAALIRADKYLDGYDDTNGRFSRLALTRLKVFVSETVLEHEDRIPLAENIDQSWAVVTTMMDLHFSLNAGNFLTTSATTSISVVFCSMRLFRHSFIAVCASAKMSGTYLSMPLYLVAQ
jgi:hypothetical protein